MNFDPDRAVLKINGRAYPVRNLSVRADGRPAPQIEPDLWRGIRAPWLRAIIEPEPWSFGPSYSSPEVLMGQFKSEATPMNYRLRLIWAERPEQYVIVECRGGENVGYIHISEGILEVYCLRCDPDMGSPIHSADVEGNESLHSHERWRLDEAVQAYASHANVCPICALTTTAPRGKGP